MATGYISLKDYRNGKEYALKAYQAALEYEKHEAGKYRMLLEIIHHEENIEEEFGDWLNEELKYTKLD